MTWANVSLHPFAIARLDFHRYVRFALDHDRHTAVVERIGPREVAHGLACLGVHAEIEPFADVQEVEKLAGLSLRLMGFPWNTKVTYAIVQEAPVDIAQAIADAKHAAVVAWNLSLGFPKSQLSIVKSTKGAA